MAVSMPSANTVAAVEAAPHHWTSTPTLKRISIVTSLGVGAAVFCYSDIAGCAVLATSAITTLFLSTILMHKSQYYVYGTGSANRKQLYWIAALDGLVALDILMARSNLQTNALDNLLLARGMVSPVNPQPSFINAVIAGISVGRTAFRLLARQN